MPGAKLNLRCSRCGSEFPLSPQCLDDNQESTAIPYPPAPEELESEPGVEATDTAISGGEIDVDAAGSAEVSVTVVEVEGAAVEVVEELEDAANFEMAEAFADAEEPVFDEPTNFQGEDSGITEKVESEGEDREIEELALDIDALEDVKFDGSEDESDAVGGVKDDQTGLQKESQTQLDDDGDLDNLLKQVEGLSSDSAASIIAEETGEQAEDEAFGGDFDASQALVKSPKVIDRQRSFILMLSCVVIFSLALWAAYGLWQHFTVDMVKHLTLMEIENQRLRLPSERIIVVLRGKIVNSSNKLVTDLKIKGILLDATGQAVAEVVTSGGVNFSEEELDLLDADKLAMLENTSVTLPPDGGKLPFIIAFYDYPEEARTCHVELSSFKVK